MSDVTVGVLQLSLKIYLLWKTNVLTCFELQLRMFLTGFPILMSGSLLCMISIDRYINVVCNTYYKKIAKKKSLPLTIISVIVIFFIWATFEPVLLPAGVDKRKVAKGYIVLAIFGIAELLISITLNLALLTNVKR